MMESINPRSLADNDTHQAVQRLFHAQALLKYRSLPIPLSWLILLNRYLYLLRQVRTQHSSADPSGVDAQEGVADLPSLEATAARTVLAILAVSPTSRGFMGVSPSVGERADRLDALLVSGDGGVTGVGLL